MKTTYILIVLSLVIKSLAEQIRARIPFQLAAAIERPDHTFGNNSTAPVLGCNTVALRFDPVKFKELKVADWYENEILNKADKKLFEELGEATYFFDVILGIPGVTCSDAENGCSYKPDCPSVRRRVDEMFPDATTEEKEEEVMKIIWVAGEFDAEGRLYNFFETLGERVQSNAQGEAGWIVDQFTFQTNENADKACETRKETNKLVYNYFFSIIPLFVGAVVGSAVDKIDPGQGGIVSAEIQGAALTAKFMIDLAEVFQNHKTKHDIPRFVLSDEPTWKFNTDDDAICQDIKGANIKPNNWENDASVQSYISRYSEHRRELTGAIAKEVLQNNDPKNSRFLERLSTAPGSARFILAHEDMATFEQSSTENLKQILIGSAMKNQNCFDLCHEDLHDTTSNMKVCDKVGAESTWCSPSSQQACRTVCLPAHSNPKYLGLVAPPRSSNDALLARWGITWADIAGASFNYSRGIEVTIPFDNWPPKLNSNVTDVASFNLTSWSPPNPFNLGVCVAPTQLEDLNANHHKPNQFPCTCSEWNQTTDFFDNAGMTGNALFRPQVREIMENHCPHELMKRKSPVARLNALCNMRMEYPRAGKKGNKMLTGAADYCDAFREEMRGKTEKEGNEHLCTKGSKLMKKIIDDEAESKGGYRNTEDVCKVYLRDGKLDY